MTRSKSLAPSKPLPPAPVPPPAPELLQTPLIFISHDTRDAAIAEAFENLLFDVTAGVLKTFRSSDRRGSSGIEFGTEWYSTIMSKLEEATDVVALLTPNSLDRPWILYEVGVARGRNNVPAFGVALGVPLAHLKGPFAQFQNSQDDEDSLTKLVMQLVRRIPGSAPRDEAIRRQVAAFRGTLTPLLEANRTTPDGTTPHTGADAVPRLFEEIKVMFRTISDRLPDDGMGRFSDRSREPVDAILAALYQLLSSERDTRERSYRSLVAIISPRYPELERPLNDVWNIYQIANDGVAAAEAVEGVAEQSWLSADMRKVLGSLSRVLRTWRRLST